MPKRPHRRGEAFFEKALLMNEMKRLPASELSFRGRRDFSVFSALKGSSRALFISSLLLHGWAPAGFTRRLSALAVSICIVREKGKGYQGEK